MITKGSGVNQCIGCVWLIGMRHLVENVNLLVTGITAEFLLGFKQQKSDGK